MKWDALEEEPCSLARTIGVIGDRWSLLILRECFLRTRRFEGFQSALGITRHLLAERLKKLVRQGVLRRIPYQEAPKRHEYILTQKGLDLYPVMVCSECGEPRLPKEVHTHPGPGAPPAAPKLPIEGPATAKRSRQAA